MSAFKTAEEYIEEISNKTREEVNAMFSQMGPLLPTAYTPIIFGWNGEGCYAVYINHFGRVVKENIDDYVDERLWVRSNPIFYNELKEILIKDDEEKEKEND